MRNNAPINHFPPTPFSPKRSPIYGEAHFYRAQAGWGTRQLTTDHRQRDEHKYGLRRRLGFWELTFAGQQAVFKHELGALYVACLLLDPPPEPIYAMAPALKVRKMSGQSPKEAELIQERNLGLDDAEAVRNLRRKQRA
jgi:hypothetical protein